jgi:hypothetical protein
MPVRIAHTTFSKHSSPSTDVRHSLALSDASRPLTRIKSGSRSMDSFFPDQLPLPARPVSWIAFAKCNAVVETNSRRHADLALIATGGANNDAPTQKGVNSKGICMSGNVCM